MGTSNVFDPTYSDISVFKEKLNQFFIANKITDEVRKNAILLNTLSEGCYVLVRNLCVLDLPEKKTYDELSKILTDHLFPVKSYFSERLKFYTTKRNLNQSAAKWEAKVKNFASNCKFGTELDIVMRGILVIGINHDKILERLLEKDATKASFSNIVKIAMVKETALKEHAERERMGPSASTSGNVNYNHHQMVGRGQNRRQCEGKHSLRPTNFGSANKDQEQPGTSKSSEYVQRKKCSVCVRNNHVVCVTSVESKVI